VIGVSDSDGSSHDWQVSPVRDTSEVRRWRPIVVGPSLVLGVDEEGRLVQFVSKTNTLIPADSSTLLFFLPLLDMEHDDFASQIGRVAKAGDELRDRVERLVQMTVSLALGQRSPTYIERALRWLEAVSPSDETRAALGELTRSRRGTQKLRQAAHRTLKRS
jgi:hypothetical protein